MKEATSSKHSASILISVREAGGCGYSTDLINSAASHADLVVSKAEIRSVFLNALVRTGLFAFSPGGLSAWTSRSTYFYSPHVIPFGEDGG